MAKNKKSGCINTLITVVFVLVLLGVGVYVAFSKISYFSGSNLFEVYGIYSDLSVAVDEGDLVTNPTTESDYTSAVTILENAGLTIFNQYDEVDPLLISSNYTLSTPFSLTDNEVAGFMNSIVADFSNLEALGFNVNSIDGFALEILETTIEEVSTDVFNLDIVIKINIESLKESFGMFGFLLPNEVYLTSSSAIELVGGNYEVTSSTLKVNNLSAEDNDSLLTLIVDILNDGEDTYTAASLQQTVGETLLDGLNLLSEHFNLSYSLSDGMITFN
ncbi:MAG: hypothetical protein AB7S44_02720 [Spirochaetales bacterium]